MKAFIPYKLTGEVEFASIKANPKPVNPQGLASSVTYIAPHPCLYPDEVDNGEFVYGQKYGTPELVVAIRERVIPLSSVRDYVSSKEKEYCKDTGSERAPRKLRQDWKEDYLVEHLPTAPIKTTTVPVMFLVNDGYVLVGTSSQKIADQVISHLLLVMSDFGVTPFDTTYMGAWLTDCLIDEDGGDIFGMVEYENRQNGIHVKYTDDHDLLDARNKAGSNPDVIVRAAMFNINEDGTCVINHKGVVSQIKLDPSAVSSSTDRTIEVKRATRILVTDLCMRIVEKLNDVEKGR